MRAGGLTSPLLICHVVARMRKKCHPSLCPLPPVADEREGPGATMVVGELTLPPTSFSTEESGHSTSPGQHTGADLLAGGQVSQACGCESGRVACALSLVRHGLARVRETRPSHLATCDGPDRRADLWGMRRPALPLTKCSNPNSRP